MTRHVTLSHYSNRSRLKKWFAATIFAVSAGLTFAGCSPASGNDINKTGLESEADARTIVTDNVRLLYPGDAAITPQNATLTPCSNYDKNAIGEGPPWGAEGSQSLGEPEQIAEAIRRTDALAESGYRLQPRGPQSKFPEERVYRDDRGVTIGITATKLPDSVYFSVFSGTPCTINKP